jgi:hypothetical protein
VHRLVRPIEEERAFAFIMRLDHAHSLAGVERGRVCGVIIQDVCVIAEVNPSLATATAT